MIHGTHIRTSSPAAASMASAWDTLCRLSTSGPCLWLVRSSAFEAAPAIGLVLLDGLSRLLVALGEGARGHG